LHGDIMVLVGFSETNFPCHFVVFHADFVTRRVNWRKISISNNVGGVKFFSSVLTRALRGARHFALVEEVPFPTKVRSQSFQVRNSVRPIHLFGRIRDHDS
jgi:hypothetical protein